MAEEEQKEVVDPELEQFSELNFDFSRTLLNAIEL